MPAERSEFPLEEPQAALERAFIDEYLRAHGHDLRMLHKLPADQVQGVLREAALYAATKLAELEARSHYIHEIHGASSRG
jgi:hypothetical protein